MNAPLRIPPPSAEDRLSHDRAVWRAYQGTGQRADGSGTLAVSVDYGDGQIAQGRAHEIDWRGVKRWRFGWAPL
jgi:hypothetical protein